MRQPKKIVTLMVTIVLSSAWVIAQGNRPDAPFEVGGGPTLFIPRTDYRSGWGIGLDGVWNASHRYGLALACGFNTLDAKGGSPSKTLTSVSGSVEILFRQQEYVRGFTSLGFGATSEEENSLFIIGIGIKIPVRRNILLRFELRDYFTEIGIPYFTFPGGRAVLKGRGTSRYLELGLGATYALPQRNISETR